nr:MAG TPA: hypothetical protein [Caudoviricetes sp.]
MKLRVDFKDDRKNITVIGLDQWDYGQKLEIYGIPDVTHAEVHFCCESDTEALIKQAQVTDHITADIPDKLLRTGENLKAYVYIATATEGKTIRTITMIVNRRQRPEDYTALPEKNLLREILEKLDLKADDIELKENELQLLSGGKGIGSKIRLPGGSGGREIELRNNGTAIQWRYTDSNDWIDLIQTEELRGKDGVTPSFIIRDGHLIAIYEEKEK